MPAIEAVAEAAVLWKHGLSLACCLILLIGCCCGATLETGATEGTAVRAVTPTSWSKLSKGPSANLSAASTDGRLTVAADGHWLEFRGKRVLLVGDSVTQGWMELGDSFDQTAYVDALSTRGINALLVWAFVGIVDQTTDGRIGYDAPEIWPWLRTAEGFDLARFNDSYFDRLRSLVKHANSKDIAVIITVHDGWTKERFPGHPFNVSNGGTLTDRSQYVELWDYRQEMPARLDVRWNRQQKHQYYLERFCHRLIQATGDLSAVMYEVFNEGEWYDQTRLRAFQVHFLDFFKARTAAPLIVNDDHVGGPDFRLESRADAISLHRPIVSANSRARDYFEHYARHFGGDSPKPILFTETVPAYQGDPATHDALMRSIWGAALGGASVLIQNDSSFGFDPRTVIASQSLNRDGLLDLEGHACRFFNASDLELEYVAPDGSLCSTGICLARRGVEYVVYSQSGTSVMVDLSDGVQDYTVRFYNPRTGEFHPGSTVVESSSNSLINKPDDRDWVIYIESVSKPRGLRGAK
ncbi:MAG: putative collagen-binding domain-containing protein [Chloroflexota bacterium]